MRRFSSEGSLLGLDILSWKRVTLKDQDYPSEVGTYTPHLEGGEEDRSPTLLPPPPVVLEPGSGWQGKGDLIKQHSISVENLQNATGYLRVNVLSEGYRAYSDSQLSPGATGSTEIMEMEDTLTPSPSSSSTSNPFSTKLYHRQHARAKLASAKLHLKSLFGPSPHSSHSNLSTTEQKDGERSGVQWATVRTRFSREELEKWAESLSALLDSRTGVSVFGAFLRSEFSEENLQFHLACEQYRQSSNNFSLQRRAKEICATYIQPCAPREVNLDCKTRELTLQLLQAPSHTSLSHAQKRVYSLLDTDCYPRFLQSTIYLTLLQEAD